MAVDRNVVMQRMNLFKDPKQMKNQFGIHITQQQIRQASQSLETYKLMSDQELHRLDKSQERKWPYPLSETQRYDMLIHNENTYLSITQTLLWKNIKDYIARNPKEPQMKNGKAIIMALQDLEGFLELNMYLGHFEENQKLIDNQTPEVLMKLFNTAYQKYNV